MDIRTVIDGLQFPEGPVACADGSVILVEIAAGALTRVAPDGTKTVVANPGGGPNGAAIGPDGKGYVVNNGGFDWLVDDQGRRRPSVQAKDYSGGRLERVDLATGAVEVLYRECGDHQLRGPNDLVCDEHGGIYFTDLGKRRARDMDVGGVYYAKRDGSSIVEVAYPLVTPNGIGLSPDGKTLYVAETEAARLWAFDIVEPGIVRKDPWPSPHGGRIVAGMGGYQRFDSLAVQADGRIAVATLINGGITVISPDGRHIEHTPMPDPMTTNICFGGPDMKTAFITLSWTGKLVAVDWPTPG
jgi:gluconolactonase